MLSHEKTHEILTSTEFKKLVSARWSFSLVMTAIMLAAYFGFILTIAYVKEILSIKLIDNVNVGIIGGLWLIVFTWLMTGAYVLWANLSYDGKVKAMNQKVQEAKQAESTPNTPKKVYA